MPGRLAGLADSLTEIVGADGLLDPAGYAIDGVRPEVVARPADRDQVSRVLAVAHAAGARVVPHGGGTAIDRGRPPTGVEIVIVLDRLDRIVEHEPADLTVTVEAGRTLAALQAALAQAGQTLALDAPLPDRATIGGILAANVSGSRRFAHGTARDLVIGMRVAQPDGTITRSGGKVVKNVAGFDLNKLYIGSHGTLAVILEATFKVAPLPRARATFAVGVDDPARLPAIAERVRAVNLPVRAIDAVIRGAGLGLSPDPFDSAPAGVLIDLVETPAAIEGEIDTLTRELAAVAAPGIRPPRIERDLDRQAALWQGVQDLGRSGPPIDLIARLGYRPHQFGAALDLVGRDFAGVGRPGIVGRAGSGVLTVCWSTAADSAPADRIARLRAAVTALGGHLIVERCPTALKETIDVWGPVGPEVRVMRAVKDQFDPGRILSPGRFLGGI